MLKEKEGATMESKWQDTDGEVVTVTERNDGEWIVLSEDGRYIAERPDFRVVGKEWGEDVYADYFDSHEEAAEYLTEDGYKQVA